VLLDFKAIPHLSEFLCGLQSPVQNMLNARDDFLRTTERNAENQSISHAPCPFIDKVNEAVFPLAVLLIVQLNHFQILLPYCSPLSFFILEISTSDGLSFCLKPMPKK
jgi:hypothetical protein